MHNDTTGKTGKTDKETRGTHRETSVPELSRRSFLTLGSAAALGGAAVLIGCSPSQNGGTSSRSTDASAAAATNGGASFMQAPAAITDIAETKEFDVVVVGAGAAGVPAALSAREKGATVALLQKEATAVSQGNTGTGIDLETSDPAGVEALVSLLLKDCQYRSDRRLIESWAYNSGEAVKWVIKRSSEADAPVVDQGNAQAMAVTTVNGYKLNYVTSFFGPKPLNTGDGMKALATVAERDGVDIYYRTPASQLVITNGAITGVIATAEDGKNIQFNAKKGVILAAGDYQNDTEMCEYYLPDVTNFGRKQFGKTGDGHKMGLWAGAVMEPIGHTKMLHDFDAGPASMCDLPYLAVTDDGKRFADESAPMSLLNNLLRTIIPPKTEAGWYSQIFDANYQAQAQGWPGATVDPTGLENYMPDVAGDKHGVLPEYIRTFKADTLDELAKKLGIDAAEFKKTVARYNELVAKGADEDFGKGAAFLKPVDTPPFYGIHRWLRISALCSGLMINEHCQCLDANGKAITGLFAVGEVGGGFYSGVDYPMTLPGYNLGHCYTQGRLTGQYVAGL